MPADPSPFAAALSQALESRGLPLDRVRARLLEYGHDVSIATLSYWRTGRSVPARRSSLNALGALEVVLRVPRGSLAAHVAPHPSSLVGGGPDQASRALSLGEQKSGRAIADEIAAEWGLSWGAGFHRVSQHDVLNVGLDRRPLAHQVRELIVADVEGFDRFVVGHESDGADSVMSVEAVSGCRLGRVAVAESVHLTVAELILDRPLHVGEPTYVTHVVHTLGSPGPLERWDRVYLHPMRECIAEISFDPEDLPTWLGRYVGAPIAEPTFERLTPIRPSSITLLQDFGPGQLHLAWGWGEPPWPS